MMTGKTAEWSHIKWRRASDRVYMYCSNVYNLIGCYSFHSPYIWYHPSTIFFDLFYYLVYWNSAVLTQSCNLNDLWKNYVQINEGSLCMIVQLSLNHIQIQWSQTGPIPITKMIDLTLHTLVILTGLAVEKSLPKMLNDCFFFLFFFLSATMKSLVDQNNVDTVSLAANSNKKKALSYNTEIVIASTTIRFSIDFPRKISAMHDLDWRTGYLPLFPIEMEWHSLTLFFPARRLCVQENEAEWVFKEFSRIGKVIPLHCRIHAGNQKNKMHGIWEEYAIWEVWLHPVGFIWRISESPTSW